MRNVEPVIEEGGSVEDVHHLRLMALLHDLVRKKGNRGAASVLGIDPRTVASCTTTGRLSWRVREALERGLQSGAGSAAVRQRERNDALEGRIEELEEKTRSVTGEVPAPSPADSSAAAAHPASPWKPGPRSPSSGYDESGAPTRGRQRIR